MLESDIRRMVKELKKVELRSSICIKCGAEFYLVYEGVFGEQRGYEECSCGGELIRQK